MTFLDLPTVAEGVIESGSDLLIPRFYLSKGLEPWIYERVAALDPRG